MKPTNMSKREQLIVSIVLSVSVIISLVFLTYSFTKVKELESVKLELKDSNKQIQELQNQVEIQKERARDAAAEALNQQRIAEKVLKDCMNK